MGNLLVPPLFGVTFAAFCLAQSDLREAARLDAEGKCGEAEHIYQAAISKASPTAALLNNVGNHYLTCGLPDRAAGAFEKLLKIAPAHPNANLQMALITVDRGQGERALHYLEKVRESGPAIDLLRAQALHYAGRHRESLALLNAIEGRAASDRPFQFAFALALGRMGLYARAETAFNELAKEAPDDPTLLFNLGKSAARAGRQDRAQRALEAALRLQPDDIDTVLELALVLAAKQDFSRAVFLLAQARRNNPKRPDVLLALARACQAAGFYGDARNAYDEYLVLRPGDDEASRDRALMRGLTGTASKPEVAAGVKEIQAHLQKHPSDPIGHFALAQLCWTSEPERALQSLSAALRFDPELTAARFARAWLLYRSGRLAESLTDLELVVRREPDNVRAVSELGLVYLSSNRPADAERTLRHALAIAPDEPQALLHLGRALLALGRDNDSEPIFERYEAVRRPVVRGPRIQAGMIELATLSPRQRTQVEIERLGRDASAHPADAELQLTLGKLLLAEGRYEEANAVLAGLLASAAEARIWHEAGAALVQAGQYTAARQLLERAIKDRPAALLDLAIATLHVAGPERALEVLDRSPKGQQSGDVLLFKARVLGTLGRKVESNQVLEEGLDRAGSRPETARSAALLLIRLGRGAEALEVLDRAGALASDDPDLLLTRAVALGVTGRTTCEKELNSIESRWPEWDRVYFIHGLWLRQAGRNLEAKQKLRIAAALSAEASPLCAPCSCLNENDELEALVCGRAH